MDNLEKYVRSLKEYLEEEERIKKSIAVKKEEFEKSIQKDKAEIEEVSSNITHLKSKIQEIGVSHFNSTGEKNLYGGLKIKETKVKKYDESDAFNWAKEKGECLSLDKKAFEKVAPVLNLDFYSEEKEPKVTFPKTIKLED